MQCTLLRELKLTALSKTDVFNHRAKMIMYLLFCYSFSNFSIYVLG